MKRTKTPSKSTEKRRRNVAHLWADKRILRFFRKHPLLTKSYYKNLRNTYLALCEIDSDFGERKEMYGFTKTVATYAGMNEATVRKYLQALRAARLIDYCQITNDNGTFGHTRLEIYKWDETSENQKARSILSILEKPVYGKTRVRENPCTGKPVYGKTPVRVYSDSINNYNELEPKNPPLKNNNILLYNNTLLKNKKNKKNKKTLFLSKGILDHFPKDWKENTAFQKALEEYALHRKEIHKPITSRAGKMIANKLSKYDKTTAIQALQRSIENGWTGIFPEAIDQSKTKPKHNRAGNNYDQYGKQVKKTALIQGE